MSGELAPVRFEITDEAGTVIAKGVTPRICFEEQVQAGVVIREIPAPPALVLPPTEN